MSDWEDAEIEIPVVSKFQDEEVSDTEQEPQQQKKLPPVKKKTDIGQKNREKEEAKLLKEALESNTETAEEKRIRLKNEVLEADLANVLDLVGDLELPRSRGSHCFNGSR